MSVQPIETRSPIRPLADGMALMTSMFGLGSGMAWLLFGHGPLTWVLVDGVVPPALMAAAFLFFGAVFLYRLRTRRVAPRWSLASALSLLLALAVELTTGLVDVLYAWGPSTPGILPFLPATAIGLGLWVWILSGGCRRAPFHRPRRITRRDIWRAVAR